MSACLRRREQFTGRVCTISERKSRTGRGAEREREDNLRLSLCEEKESVLPEDGRERFRLKHVPIIKTVELDPWVK